MKRDMDLAREILLKIEGNPDAIGFGWIQNFQVDGHPKNEVAYHVMLLQEAGLIEAISAIHTGPDGFNWMPERLTWVGHEFLDASREESLWQKAKKIAAEKAGGATFEMLKAILTKLAMDQVVGP